MGVIRHSSSVFPSAASAASNCSIASARHFPLISASAALRCHSGLLRSVQESSYMPISDSWFPGKLQRSLVHFYDVQLRAGDPSRYRSIVLERMPQRDLAEPKRACSRAQVAPSERLVEQLSHWRIRGRACVPWSLVSDMGVSEKISRGKRFIPAHLKSIRARQISSSVQGLTSS